MSSYKVGGYKTGPKVLWLAAALCAPTALPLYAAQETTVKTAQSATPSAAEILARLKPGHPRLLADQSTWNSLPQRIAGDAKLKPIADGVRAEADKMLTQEPSKYEIPDGKRLLNTSRRVLTRSKALGMAYRLTNDAKYLDRLWQELEDAANFKDWNPSHFLDTAEMTHAFAIAYDWHYNAWTPQQRATLRTAMIEKGLKPALAGYRSGAWWTKAHHNWNQVCNGGIGIGALALADEEPQLCGEILQNAIKLLPLAMKEFAPDGAWSEGPGYWDYATAYNVMILAALQTALGTDYGLGDIPGFSQTALFPVYMSGPIGLVFNYADSGDRAPGAPQMYWLANRYKQPLAIQFADRYAGPNAYSLLWRPAGAIENNTPPLDKYFRGSEVATMRSSWNSDNALFLGFKAGDNKANHSHLDLGTWVMDALGERWIVNLRGDNYNLPDYFGKLRWTYYRLRAEGHNTLVLNPNQQPDQDPKAAAKIINYRSEPQRAFAVADLSAAYKGANQGAAQNVRRGWMLLNRQQVLVQDEFKAEKATDAWWFMHTPAQISLADNDKTALLSIKGKQVRVQLLSPARAKFQVREAAPLPSSPQPPKQGENNNVRKLTVHLENASDERIAVLLTPLTGTNVLGAPAIKPLSEW
jgi:hypothetical protein